MFELSLHLWNDTYMIMVGCRRLCRVVSCVVRVLRV